MKGTVELTGKLVRMESGHPFTEKALPVGFVHLVDPKLALHLVGKIENGVGIHDFKRDLKLSIEVGYGIQQ